MESTQQFREPVEGLELPADPHKVQPLQPEARPAVPEVWSRGEGREEDTHKTQSLHQLLNNDLFVMFVCF